MSPARVGIAGLGLIGASAGLGLRRAGFPVTGVEPDSAAGAVALARGAVQALLPDVDSLGRDCDVILLAAHPAANLDLLRQLAASGPPARLLVTDTGSVKRVIAAAGRELFPDPGGPTFVPGHPMAGAEASGPGAARAGLFEGATWFLCCEGPPPPVLAGLVESLGARVRSCDAGTHDRLVGLLSHLPQALAYAVAAEWRAAELAGADGGPVARELARLSLAAPELWIDILAANRDVVAPGARGLAERLGALAGALEAGDEAAVRAALREWLS